MNMRSPTDMLDTARWLLQENRGGEARVLLQQLVAMRPPLMAARQLLALALEQMGDLAGAEAQLRDGLRHDCGNPALAIALADLLATSGRQAEAEPVLRAALRKSRQSVTLAIRLSEMLIAAGRPAESLLATARFAAAAAPDHALLAQHAAALKALGRTDEVLDINQRAATLFPADIVAHHNLAASLGDAARFAEAEASAQRAFAAGGTAPQTWLVYARALLGQHRLDEAERALRETVRRAPDYADAHRDLTQLIWMRTEDAGAAIAVLDDALRAHPHVQALHEIRATTLVFAGDAAGADATLARAIALHPQSAGLHIAASEVATRRGEADRAVAHARAAASLAPGDVQVGKALFRACVAVGDLAPAAKVAQHLVEANPLDQMAIAYQATAWRLLGDPRYAPLYDYRTLVRDWRLDVPDGWSSLEAYLADLTPALERVHPFRTHPLDQSVRHGSQASNLKASDDPAIMALFPALDGPIRRHLACLGTGADPVRSRNTGNYAIQGIWSVRLRPGGFHTDHVHPQGWLSSACYIALPDRGTGGADPGREGWIKFGEPGTPTTPALAAEHFIQPEPGMLVLFPSYMWHGTIPSAGARPRLSVAFDLEPR